MAAAQTVSIRVRGAMISARKLPGGCCCIRKSIAQRVDSVFMVPGSPRLKQRRVQRLKVGIDFLVRQRRLAGLDREVVVLIGAGVGQLYHASTWRFGERAGNGKVGAVEGFQVGDVLREDAGLAGVDDVVACGARKSRHQNRNGIRRQIEWVPRLPTTGKPQGMMPFHMHPSANVFCPVIISVRAPRANL